MSSITAEQNALNFIKKKSGMFYINAINKIVTNQTTEKYVTPNL